MRIYENETPEQLKHRLHTSVELSLYRSTIVQVIFYAIVIAGLSLLFSRQYGDIPHLSWIMAGFLAACSAPPIGICLFRIFQIQHKREHYTYHQVKLTNLHRSIWAEYSYFTVLLDDGQKKTIVNTHSIFTTHGLITPRLEDYVGKTAVVGYNEETGQVVFLG